MSRSKASGERGRGRALRAPQSDTQRTEPIDTRARQMQHPTSHEERYTYAELQQSLAWSTDVRVAIRGARGTLTQFLQQHLSSAGQQGAQRIDEEVAATGAIDLVAVV